MSRAAIETINLVKRYSAFTRNISTRHPHAIWQFENKQGLGFWVVLFPLGYRMFKWRLNRARRDWNLGMVLGKFRKLLIFLSLITLILRCGFMGKLEDEILNLLSESEPLTLMEISERLNKKPKVVFRALRKLFEEGKISCDAGTRRYTLERDYVQEQGEEKEELDIENLKV